MRSRSRQDKSLITLIRSFGRHSLPTSRVDTMAQSMVPSTPSIQIRPNQSRLVQYRLHYGHIFIRPLCIRPLASPREGVGRERVCAFGFTPIPVKVYKLDAMKKWAPAGVSFIGPAEENWAPNLSYSMGIEENVTDPENPRKFWELIPM